MITCVKGGTYVKFKQSTVHSSIILILQFAVTSMTAAIRGKDWDYVLIHGTRITAQKHAAFAMMVHVHELYLLAISYTYEYYSVLLPIINYSFILILFLPHT